MLGTLLAPNIKNIHFIKNINETFFVENLQPYKNGPYDFLKIFDTLVVIAILNNYELSLK